MPNAHGSIFFLKEKRHKLSQTVVVPDARSHVPLLRSYTEGAQDPQESIEDCLSLLNSELGKGLPSSDDWESVTVRAQLQMFVKRAHRIWQENLSNNDPRPNAIVQCLETMPHFTKKEYVMLQGSVKGKMFDVRVRGPKDIPAIRVSGGLYPGACRVACLRSFGTIDVSLGFDPVAENTPSEADVECGKRLAKLFRSLRVGEEISQEDVGYHDRFTYLRLNEVTEYSTEDTALGCLSFHVVKTTEQHIFDRTKAFTTTMKKQAPVGEDPVREEAFATFRVDRSEMGIDGQFTPEGFVGLRTLFQLLNDADSPQDLQAAVSALKDVYHNAEATELVNPVVKSTFVLESNEEGERPHYRPQSKLEGSSWFPVYPSAAGLKALQPGQQEDVKLLLQEALRRHPVDGLDFRLELGSCTFLCLNDPDCSFASTETHDTAFSLTLPSTPLKMADVITFVYQNERFVVENWASGPVVTLRSPVQVRVSRLVFVRPNARHSLNMELYRRLAPEDLFDSEHSDIVAKIIKELSEKRDFEKGPCKVAGAQIDIIDLGVVSQREVGKDFLYRHVRQGEYKFSYALVPKDPRGLLDRCRPEKGEDTSNVEPLLNTLCDAINLLNGEIEPPKTTKFDIPGSSRGTKKSPLKRKEEGTPKPSPGGAKESPPEEAASEKKEAQGTGSESGGKWLKLKWLTAISDAASVLSPVEFDQAVKALDRASPVLRQKGLHSPGSIVCLEQAKDFVETVGLSTSVCGRLFDEYPLTERRQRADTPLVFHRRQLAVLPLDSTGDNGLLGVALHPVCITTLKHGRPGEHTAALKGADPYFAAHYDCSEDELAKCVRDSQLFRLGVVDEENKMALFAPNFHPSFRGVFFETHLHATELYSACGKEVPVIRSLDLQAAGAFTIPPPNPPLQGAPLFSRTMLAGFMPHYNRAALQQRSGPIKMLTVAHWLSSKIVFRKL